MMVRSRCSLPFAHRASLFLAMTACGNGVGNPTSEASASSTGEPSTSEATVTDGPPTGPTTTEGPGTSMTTETGPCEDGAVQCLAPDERQVCDDGRWTDAPCLPGQGCDADTGACAVCTCEIGAVRGCIDKDTADQCNCFGFEPVTCAGDTACAESEGDFACRPIVCAEGEAECPDSDSIRLCNATGTAWEPASPCGGTDQCVEPTAGAGECISACAAAQQLDSSVGCEFWAVDMANVPPRDAYVFGVAVSNPSATSPVKVEIYDRNAGGQEQKIAEGTIAAREVEVFRLSGTSNMEAGFYAGDAGFLGSGIAKGRAFRIVSDLPIVATQFNPLGGAKAFTTDASLLLPTHALGDEYIHLAWEKGLGAGSALVVVATADDTTITITPTVSLPAGQNGMPALTAGQATVLPLLKKYDYLQLSSAGKDLTASRITADRPVAVFGGHSCGQVPDVETDFCDHLEEQIFPVDTWGEHYVAARSPKRADEPMIWRVIAAKDDTIVEFEPPVSIGPEAELGAGKFVEFVADGDFEITTNNDHPVLVAGYIYGCKSTLLPSCPGDPSMVLSVPVEQWRSDYVFLVDYSYTNDNIKLVRAAGKNVSVGCLGTVTDWSPVSAAYESAVVNINPGEANCSPGTNTATGAAPFSVMVVGEAASTSYAYPGGLQLKPINAQ